MCFPVSFWTQIPFADALDLFRGRKVYLEDGFAYVPLKDIVAIILNEFRATLSKALAVSVLFYVFIWHHYKSLVTVFCALLQSKLI